MTSDYVPFQLLGEAFLVPASSVREILGGQSCTKIPQQSSRISGVFPWNGRAIPLIELSVVLRRSGSSPGKGTESSDESKSRTLVVETKDDIVGLLVDEVREVVRLQVGDFRSVHAADELYTSAEVEWSDGVARLLDVESMVNECFQMG